MKKICETLAASALFNGWNHDAFHEYCDRTSIRFVLKGETLVNEGDPCTGIGIIIEGQLATQKYNRSGDFATLELMGIDEIFGEDLIFNNKRIYSNTIKAATNSRVVFIPREVVMLLLDKNPAMMQNILSIISNRIISQNRRICLLSQKNLRCKIVSYLLDLLHEKTKKEECIYKSAHSRGPMQKVELPVSKEVVSRLLAMPRPSFSRELVTMAHEGLIRVSGRVIWLMDLEHLENGSFDDFQMI